MPLASSYSFFFFNDTATTEIYTLSLHDALPIFTKRSVMTAPERKLIGTQTIRPRHPRSRNRRNTRSEEHTSELQSLTNLVCRLLLEKKKKNRNRSERQVSTRTRREAEYQKNISR